MLVGRYLFLFPTLASYSHSRSHSRTQQTNMRPDIWVARHDVSNDGWVSCWDAGHVVGRLSKLRPWDCWAGPPRSSGRMTTEQGGLQ